MASKTVGETFDGLVSRLAKITDTPDLDAQVLLAHALERPRSWVMAHPEAPLSHNEDMALEALVSRLEQGEPLPYVLGRRDFFGLAFEVTPDVLIPRPETELLVERALAWLEELEERRAVSSAPRALDVGTGSGCIAVALAVHATNLRLTATDISPQALAVARRNAERHHVAERISFLEADLVPAPTLPNSFDLIVANLPYIPSERLRGLPIYGREPSVALDGGADGMALIRRLLSLSKAPDLLAPGGLLLMEIEASEGAAALSLACDTFDEAEIHLHQDLAGHDRLLEVQV